MEDSGGILWPSELDYQQGKKKKNILVKGYGSPSDKRILPGGSAGKEFACNAEDPGWIPGLGRSPAEGNGHPLQYSCLENSMDGGAWQATVHGGHKESGMTE